MVHEPQDVGWISMLEDRFKSLHIPIQIKRESSGASYKQPITRRNATRKSEIQQAYICHDHNIYKQFRVFKRALYWASQRQSY